MWKRLRKFVDRRKAEDPIWLTVYSDMMTNLMLFFLMLYGLTQVGSLAMAEASKAFEDSLKSGAGQQGEGTGAERLKELEKKLNEMGGGDIEVKFGKDATRIIFSAPILFDLGRADVKATASGVLHEIAGKLRGMPNKIVVEGHTDNIPLRGGGRYNSNWDLSSARAENIIKYFVHREMFPPRQFAVAAYGEHNPVVPNDTEKNRAKNRRVELVVLKGKDNG